MRAPRDVVFDVIAAPYLGRPPRAMADKLEVLERRAGPGAGGAPQPLRNGRTATTVETVRFTRPRVWTSGWCGDRCRTYWRPLPWPRRAAPPGWPSRRARHRLLGARRVVGRAGGGGLGGRGPAVLRVGPDGGRRQAASRPGTADPPPRPARPAPAGPRARPPAAASAAMPVDTGAPVSGSARGRRRRDGRGPGARPVGSGRGQERVRRGAGAGHREVGGRPRRDGAARRAGRAGRVLPAGGRGPARARTGWSSWSGSATSCPRRRPR